MELSQRRGCIRREVRGNRKVAEQRLVVLQLQKSFKISAHGLGRRGLQVHHGRRREMRQKRQQDGFQGLSARKEIVFQQIEPTASEGIAEHKYITTARDGRRRSVSIAQTRHATVSGTAVSQQRTE